MTHEEISDVAIVGGGVVGCAIAHAFAQKKQHVVLLEKNSRLGQGTTSRNSGVVHSGLYYPPHSLKAQLCVRGNRLLYEWCEKYRVAYKKVGKLVVAKTSEELPRLHELYENGLASHAPGIELLDAARLSKLDPEVRGHRAMWCPQSGIVDAVGLAVSLAQQAEMHGAIILTHAKVQKIDVSGGVFHLQTSRGPLFAHRVINAAGLDADMVAQLVGVTRWKIYPCRGDYFWLKTPRTFEHLIYPVKPAADVGLGVHLTLTLDGSVRLGPDTEYVSQKDDYQPAEHKKEKFWNAACRLLGDLPLDALMYDSCGIRPKLRRPEDTTDSDFVMSEEPRGVLHLVGIDSPGLTSALAMAEHVVQWMAK